MPRRAWKTEDTVDERNLLEKLYFKQKLTAEEVGKRLGWAERTVYDRLAFHGLSEGNRKPRYCNCCGQVIKAKRKK